MRGVDRPEKDGFGSDGIGGGGGVEGVWCVASRERERERERDGESGGERVESFGVVGRGTFSE